jgi:drug/metabolite transporter (DMT)-like permease
LLHDRRWLLAIGADGLGLGLLVVALTNGPVTLVQPLQILGLLVALPVGTALGGPRPTSRAMGAALVVVLGLGTFLALLGDPGEGRSPSATTIVVLSAILLAAGGLGLLLTRHRGSVMRAVVLGGTSGAWFGLSAVLLRAVDLRWQAGGLAGFGHSSGIVAVSCLVIVGATALATGQLSFQMGSLAASLPAQTIADPIVAVLLGPAVLGEHVALSRGRVIVHVVALAAIAVGVWELAHAEVGDVADRRRPSRDRPTLGEL